MSDIKHWASDIHVNGSDYDYNYVMSMSMSVSLSLSMPTSVTVPVSMSMSVVVSVSVSMYESWRWHLAMAKLSSFRALPSCSWTHVLGLTNVARLKLACSNLAMKIHTGRVFAL